MDAIWKINLLLGLISFYWVSVVTAKSRSLDFKCPENKFQCGSEKCIPGIWACDGDDDCSDGSDEINCPPTTCRPEHEFACKNRKCIPSKWACDSEKDCSDGSDEMNCPQPTCSPSHFQCNNSRCVLEKWRCDNQDDCGDKSDEIGCKVSTVTCPKNEFKCTNDVCISQAWVCDGERDCADGSDEKKCDKKKPTCSPTDFTCKNKQCIHQNWHCDGNDDCHDGSDELNCTTVSVHHKTCGPIFWKCMSGDCIKKEWRCDGEDDCMDKSDENDCSAIKCSSGKMHCNSTNHCIPKSFRCNGRRDCSDGSDEIGCTPKKISCGPQDFNCSSTECISMGKVCDRHPDCSKGEDEPITCFIDECKVNNGHCSHICTDMKISYKCSCPRGFRLDSDQRTCIDLNECKKFGSCHQKCYNIKGHYKCDCADGYLLEPDRKTCRAAGDTPWIYFSNRVDIRKILPNGKDYRVVVNGLRGAVSIDFDIKNDHIYWTDILSDTIHRANVNMPNLTEIIHRNVHTSDGIAVDWINDKLYWTDTGYNTIEVSELDGKNYMEIVNTGLNEPRAISLDPFEGYIYWSDWGKEAAIERISMDGQSGSRKKIINKNIYWPNGLTVDLIQKKIYWMDAKTQHLEVADLDGQNRMLLKRTGLYHPFALDNFEEKLYWTDWKSDRISSISKFDTSERNTLTQGLYAPMDIKVYHSAKQPKGINRCGSDNNGCSHLCLLANHDGLPTASCKCPRGMVLVSGKKCEGSIRPRMTTRKPATTTLLITSGKAKTKQMTTHKMSTKRGPISIHSATDNDSGLQSLSKKVHSHIGKKKVKSSSSVSVGTIIAIILSVCLVAFIVLGILYYIRRRNMNKGHVMYYKDMSTTPLEDDFDIEQEETDEKGQIIPEFS